MQSTISQIFGELWKPLFGRDRSKISNQRAWQLVNSSPFLVNHRPIMRLNTAYTCPCATSPHFSLPVLSVYLNHIAWAGRSPVWSLVSLSTRGGYLWSYSEFEVGSDIEQDMGAYSDQQAPVCLGGVLYSGGVLSRDRPYN